MNKLINSKIKFIKNKLPVLNTFFYQSSYYTTNKITTNHTLSKSLWNNLIYPISKETFLTKNLINKYLTKFYLETVNLMKDNEHMLLIPRLILINNQYVSLSKLLKINKINKDETISYLLDLIDLCNEAYKNIPIKSIIFSYGVRKGKLPIENKVTTKYNEDISHHIFYKNKLPIAYKPEDYGKIISKDNNNYIISLSKNVFITLKVEENNYFINYVKNGNILFT
jgi:hypothetical protein